MRRHPFVSYHQDVTRPEYEQAMAELRRSLWYRLGIVLIWRIIVADFASWCLVGGAAARLGANDAQQRAIGGVGIGVFLACTAASAVISVPMFLTERRCRRKFAVSAFDETWRNKQFFGLWRDVFTMRLLSRRSGR